MVLREMKILLDRGILGQEEGGGMSASFRLYTSNQMFSNQTHTAVTVIDYAPSGEFGLPFQVNSHFLSVTSRCLAISTILYT